MFRVSGSHSLRLRSHFVVACFLATSLVAGTVANAHPLEGITATVRWPDNTRINIYIPDHPTDAAVNEDIRAGIERWAPRLAANTITFTFTMAAPPNPLPANSVVVTYPATVQGDDENEGYGSCTDNGTRIVDGAIEIESDQTSGAGMRNLAMHEFGHVLGLADDATAAGEDHNCMDHETEAAGVQDFTERDLNEIASLYGAIEDGANADGDIEGNSNSIGPGQWEYIYNVTWSNGPEIPILEIAIQGHPTQVNVVQMPPGWVLNYPPQVIDGIRLPAPNPNTPILHFYAAVPGAALRAGNQVGQFRIQSQLPPGPGLAHAMIQGTGGNNWTLFNVPVPSAGPSSVPTASGWGLTSLALLVLTGGTLIVRNGAAGRNQLCQP